MILFNMRIKKGDTVTIVAGKDKGKTGKVMRVDVRSGRIVVEGVNVYKKHVRPKKQGEKGEIVDVVRPIHGSNVMLVCPSCSKASRGGYRMEKSNKARHCKKCKGLV